MKIDRTELSGLIVLFVGVILLAFTFFSAYGFLSGSLSIVASTDLTELFGRAMAPLIEAIIHILYLGVMGWIGSILTIRAVQLLKREKEATTAQPQVKTETKQPTPLAAAKTEPKQETKKPEVKAETEPAAPQATAKAELEPEVKESKKVESQEKDPVEKQPSESEKGTTNVAPEKTAQPIS